MKLTKFCPYMIHRKPRVLKDTYCNWKASEHRNWLLFYSLPCLKDKLPDVYIIHFSCLVEAIYILLHEGISLYDISRADLLLTKFVHNFEKLYGKRFMSLNVHNLTHLLQFVKLWGQLWAWSCFCFESFNGEIKKSIHGTGNVCKQIYWILQAQKRIESKAKTLPPGKVKTFVLNMSASKSLSGFEAFQCFVVQTSSLPLNFSHGLKHNLKDVTGIDSENDFVNVSKIARNGHLMYSKTCSKVKKENSYTIHLEKELTFCDAARAIEFHHYIMKSSSQKVFAVGRLVFSGGFIFPQRVPHLKKIIYSRIEYEDVVPAEYLKEPMMVLNDKKDTYAALFPNNIERD